MGVIVLADEIYNVESTSANNIGDEIYVDWVALTAEAQQRVIEIINGKAIADIDENDESYVAPQDRYNYIELSLMLHSDEPPAEWVSFLNDMSIMSSEPIVFNGKNVYLITVRLKEE